MREIIAKPDIVIPLGRQGENGAEEVIFDVAGWAELYGTGSFELLNRRPSENTPYTCSITESGGAVHWIIQSADVALIGHGRCELTYVVGDRIAKSVAFATCVLPSIEGAGTVPPPYESRIQDLILASAQVEQDKEAADGFREDAEAWATGKRGGEPVPASDETYQNNAEFYAMLAEQGAEHAGYAWFEVNDADGCMYITMTDSISEEVAFHVNEEEGILEVIYT